LRLERAIAQGQLEHALVLVEQLLLSTLSPLSGLLASQPSATDLLTLLTSLQLDGRRYLALRRAIHEAKHPERRLRRTDVLEAYGLVIAARGALTHLGFD